MMLRTALRAATRVPGFATTRAAARQQQRSASTVAGILDEAVKDIPWREVAKDKQAEVKWSVSDLQRETYALANGLGELGLGPGDSIITILPTNAENLVATLAAASLGVNVLPTQPTSAGSLEVLLTQSGAKGVIFDSGQAQGVIDELLPKVTEQMLYLKDLDRIEDERFPALDLVVTTDYDLTDNGVINYRQMFMYNNVNRCQVKRASKIIDADTAVVGGASNKDIIAAADRVASKLGISNNSQITVNASSPHALAVAATAAIRANALLHVGESSVPSNTIVIDDSSLA